MIRERIVARIQAKHPNLHAKFQVTVEEWAEKGYELESWQFNSIDTRGVVLRNCTRRFCEIRTRAQGFGRARP